MFTKLASIFTAAAIAALAVAPASADTRSVSVKVSYADLDLTRAEGVQTLSFRIAKAVDAACGQPHDTASITIARRIKACRADAVSAAVAAIDAPLLTALHQGGANRQLAGL